MLARIGESSDGGSKGCLPDAGEAIIVDLGHKIRFLADGMRQQMGRTPHVLGIFAASIPFAIAPLTLQAAERVSHHGVTWTFSQEHRTGQFVTGDYWVVGPVTIVDISTDLHASGFTPGPDDDGSMVNPKADGLHGYDGSLSSYRRELNAAHPHGRPLSSDNPLVLPPHSSLVSMVSWLYASPQDKEPGTPGFNGGTKAPRPVTRSGAILTVLPEAPPEGSFRPPYCGSDKTVRFHLRDLDYSQLCNLAPVADVPDPKALAGKMSRPWIDHVHEYLGAMVHPSENMPNYGRDMAKIVGDMALLVNLDFSMLLDRHDKADLVVPLVQFGIDSTGIADAGGGWPENGGHGLGRKLPILFAGALLNDRHMLEVGQWKTRFQDDEQTFYVTRREVDITHSQEWDPDHRAKDKATYDTKDIGMPEWGVRHTMRPAADNRGWRTPYREINGAAIPAFALAASIMQRRQEWNHEAYFDYATRSMATIRQPGAQVRGPNVPTIFVQNMWDAYHEQAGLTWQPSPGRLP